MVFAIPPPAENEEEKNTEPPFNGKVNKLTTLTAGLASTVFNRTLLKQKYDPETEKEVIVGS